MSTNSQLNKKSIEDFRKQLEDMVEDISSIDVSVLNRALAEGERVIKRLTPVGVYPGHVSFDTKNGKHVEFDVTKRTGGTLRREWRIKPARKIGTSVRGELYNNTEYASFVNYGHRVVNRSGETIGWVNGKFMLEKAILRIDKAMLREFNKEIERVNRSRGR